MRVYRAMQVAEIVEAVREEQLQDAVRLLMERDCTVAVYARHVLRVEHQGRGALLASLTRKLHALFGLTEPTKPCTRCPDRGGVPS